MNLDMHMQHIKWEICHRKKIGRLTLNPFRHLDPAGTLCLLLFHVGWGKPVQVDPYFFKDKKQGMIWTAVAGPLVNLVLGFVFILLEWFASCVRISWCDCFLFTCIIPNNSGYEYWVRGYLI